MDEDDKIAVIQTMKTVWNVAFVEFDGGQTKNEVNIRVQLIVGKKKIKNKAINAVNRQQKVIVVQTCRYNSGTKIKTIRIAKAVHEQYRDAERIAGENAGGAGKEEEWAGNREE